MYSPPKDLSSCSDSSGDEVRDRELCDGLLLEVGEDLGWVGQRLDQGGGSFVNGHCTTERYAY
jgi:hypothetical protein